LIVTPRIVKFIVPSFLPYGSVCVDSIATGYKLDGLWIESWWGEISAPVQTYPVVQPTSYTMGTMSFLE